MNAKFFQNKIILSLTALFCCALWGISTPIVKIGYAYLDAEHVPSLLLWVGIQFVLAGILTLSFSSASAKKLALPKRKSIKGVLIISFFQTVLQYTLLYIGLSNTSSVKGAILKSTDVFFVALLTSCVFRFEKLTLRKLIACIMGFAGIVIMNLDGLSLNFNLQGDGVVLLAIFFYSFSVALTGRFTQDEDPVVLCGYQMAFGGVVVLLFGALFGGSLDFIGMLPILLILALIYAASYSLWTVLLKNNPASRVIIYSFTTPIFGVIFSSFMLTEQSGVALTSLLSALVLVCVGILIWGKSGKTEK